MSFSSSKRRQEVVEGAGRPKEVVGKRGGFVDEYEKQRQLTKLLMNVNIEKSLGPVKVVISPENTVGDLIKAAIEIYGKEKRRPLLDDTDPRCFELHYSQFSLQSEFSNLAYFPYMLFRFCQSYSYKTKFG